MSFIRQLVERKISDLTGSAVTFGGFKFSPMSGTIEVLGLRVAPERFAIPFLAVDRIEAKIAVARALKGEIVVKMMTIEKPVVSLTIRSDGTTNFASARSGLVEASVAREGSAGGIWEFDAERIQVVDGKFEYRDATRNNYAISIDGINATVAPERNDLAITLTADSVGRRDRPVELGNLKLMGKLTGGGFKNFGSSALSSRASIADSLVIQLTSTMIANRSFDAEVAGGLKLTTLFNLLPLGMALPWMLSGDTSVGIRGHLAFDHLRSVRITRLELKTDAFSVERTFGQRQTS